MTCRTKRYFGGALQRPLFLACVLAAILSVAWAVPAKSIKKSTARKSPASSAKKTTAKSTTSKKTASKKATAKAKTTTSKKSTRTARGGKKSTRSKQVLARQTWRNRQMKPEADRYREIQRALIGKGYLQGAPTGSWDQSSTEALKRFQADQNLDATGKIDSLSLIALGLGPKYSSAASPKPPQSQ